MESFSTTIPGKNAKRSKGELGEYAGSFQHQCPVVPDLNAAKHVHALLCASRSIPSVNRP